MKLISLVFLAFALETYGPELYALKEYASVWGGRPNWALHLCNGVFA